MSHRIRKDASALQQGCFQRIYVNKSLHEHAHYSIKPH